MNTSYPNKGTRYYLKENESAKAVGRLKKPSISAICLVIPTSSFIEQFLDESCNILYYSRYSASICAEVQKEKVSELAENSSVVSLDLYSEYDILPEDDKLSPELVAFKNDLDDSEIVPIWVTLVSPSEEEIEAIVS